MNDDGRMRRFVSVEALFSGRHFDRQIIILCVSWYTSFKLSFRDLVIMMADRGISLAHTTILRWVQHYLPEFEKGWKRYARSVGGSWRMDETYIKVRGQWQQPLRSRGNIHPNCQHAQEKRRSVSKSATY
jgi:transposase-like protein